MSEGRESTRQRMLDAGIELWESEAPAELFGGLSVAKVSRTAGVTRTTFYAYWSSTDEYLLDLARHLSDSERGIDPIRPGRGANALRSEGMRLVDRFLTASDLYIESLTKDRRLRLRLGFTAKADDPEIADALRAVLTETEQLRSRIFSDGLPSYGRVARSPMELHHLQAAFSALAEGLALRHVLEPERFPIRIYGLCALSLLFVVSARSGDSRDLYDVLEAANDWASSAAATRRNTATERSTPLSPALVRELVVQARRSASSEGWLDFSLAGLATITNTPEARVTQTFGSKFGLEMAVFLLNVSERYDELDPDLDPLATVRAMIAANHEEMQRTPTFAQAIMAIIAGGATFGRPRGFDFDPHPRFVAAVRRAQDVGQLDPTLDTEQLATAIGRATVLANTPTNRVLTPDLDTVELLLRGAGAAPPAG